MWRRCAAGAVLSLVGFLAAAGGSVRQAAADSGVATCGALVFSDDFNRADSNTTMGSGWTASQGTWGISSNRAYLVSDGLGTSANLASVAGGGAADFCVEMTAAVVQLTATYFGPTLVVRSTGLDDNLRVSVTTAGKWILTEVNAGIATTLCTSTETAANGDVLRLEAVGNGLSLWINGTERCVVQSNKNVTATGMGIGYGGAAVCACSARAEDYALYAAGMPGAEACAWEDHGIPEPEGTGDCEGAAGLSEESFGEYRTEFAVFGGVVLLLLGIATVVSMGSTDG